MKTRKKILLITISISLVLLLILTSIVFTLERTSMEIHSMKYMKEKSNAFEKIFYSEINSLEALCIDWAFWDDTYEFIENRNERYIASNLVESTFTDAKINVYDDQWNEKEMPEIFLSPEIRGKTGFLKIDGRIVLLSSKPILPSSPSAFTESRGIF